MCISRYCTIICCVVLWLWRSLLAPRSALFATTVHCFLGNSEAQITQREEVREVPLVKKLERIQHEKGMSDSEMAKLLGVSRSLWAQTRREEIPLGDKVRRGAARLRGQYSGLEEAVLASLEE